MGVDTGRGVLGRRDDVERAYSFTVQSGVLNHSARWSITYTMENKLGRGTRTLAKLYINVSTDERDG